MLFRTLFSLCAFIYPLQSYALILSKSRYFLTASKKLGQFTRIPSAAIRPAKSEWRLRFLQQGSKVSSSFFLENGRSRLGRFNQKAEAVHNFALAGDADETELAADQPRECVVRCIDGEPHLTVTLTIEGRFKTLSRMQDDAVGGAMERLAAMNDEILNKQIRRSRSSPDRKNTKGKRKGKRQQDHSIPPVYEDFRDIEVS